MSHKRSRKSPQFTKKFEHKIDHILKTKYRKIVFLFLWPLSEIGTGTSKKCLQQALNVVGRGDRARGLRSTLGIFNSKSI